MGVSVGVGVGVSVAMGVEVHGCVGAWVWEPSSQWHHNDNDMLVIFERA